VCDGVSSAHKVPVIINSIAMKHITSFAIDGDAVKLDEMLH